MVRVSVPRLYKKKLFRSGAASGPWPNIHGLCRTGFPSSDGGTLVELHYAELQSKLPGELDCLYSSSVLDWMYAEFADGF